MRTVSNFIDLIQFHLISQMLAKFFGAVSETTVAKLRKRKRKIFVSVHLLHKAGAFHGSHVTTARKCTKKRDAHVNLLFY